MDTEMLKILAEFLTEEKIILEILNLLPTERHSALVIISMVVDKYAADHKMDIPTTWQMLHETALEVYKLEGSL